MSNRLNKFLNSIKKEEVPFVLITHSNCFDGTGAVLAVFTFCDKHKIERPKVIPMQYGDKLDINEYSDFNVLITDFSFDRDILVELENTTHDLFVIDHHSSAKKDLDGLDYCYFDMEHSGASLTWVLLNNEVPELIKYIEDRDLWKWALYRSKELSAAMNLIAKDDYDKLLAGIKQGATFTSELIRQGESIVKYQNAIINGIEKKFGVGKVKMIRFEGHDVPLLNSTHLISEVGNMLTKYAPFSVQYFITDTEIVFSFRAAGKVDLTELVIPKGHPNAAGRGFKLKDVDLNIILGDKDIDIGKYLIERLRVSTKKETTGGFRFSKDSSDLVTIGVYSTVNNGERFFSKQAIDEVSKKEVMFCERCQPHVTNIKDPSSLVNRMATIDETNVCAKMDNVKVEVDEGNNTVKIMAVVKPYGPKANHITEDNLGDYSMAYRGFANGKELVNIVTFDVVSKYCLNKRM